VLSEFSKEVLKGIDRYSTTDPVVCPDCNIEDALLPSMIREIAQYFLV